MSGALVNITLVHGFFNYTGLRAQRRSHSVVYQLFGQAAARLRDGFAREQVFPLGSDRVYYLPSGAFALGHRLAHSPLSPILSTSCLQVGGC